MEINTPAAQSSLHISEDVIATIADETVKELEGIHSLAILPARVGKLAAAVGRPVRITYSGDVAQIDIGVVLDLEHRLKDVCEQLQDSIKDAVQNMTGVTVSKVNVYVTGVCAQRQ